MNRFFLFPEGSEFGHSQYSFVGVALHTDTLEKMDVYVSKQDIEGLLPLVEEGRYRNFKGGEYFCIGTCEYCGMVFALYKSLYDSEDHPKGTLWARPLDEFFGTKEVDGVEVSRFEHIGE
jgi:hypothetical protein